MDAPEIGSGRSFDPDDPPDAPDDLDRWQRAIVDWERCFQAWLQSDGTDAHSYVERELQRTIVVADDLATAIRERLALRIDADDAVDQRRRAWQGEPIDLGLPTGLTRAEADRI